MELETSAAPWQRNVQIRSLIFGIQLQSQTVTPYRFNQSVQSIPRLRQPWIECRQIKAIDSKEFFPIWASALKKNLCAVFDPSVAKEVRQQLVHDYAVKTQGNWWAIQALIQTYHEVLGGFGNKPERNITHEVIQRVGERFAKVDWQNIEAEEQAKLRRGRASSTHNGS